MNRHLLIIVALSIATHFAYFGHPNETVFDEVHFGKFISGYYTGEYYFDIHPPLGKLMIAGFAKFFDFEPAYNFTNIGDKFPDNRYLALRFLPALTGTLLPLVIYLLILELGVSPVRRSLAEVPIGTRVSGASETSYGVNRLAAFAGALLVIFDNALLTQSRLILLDPFLLLFGFASLLFYFRYLSQQNRHSNILKNVGMLQNSSFILAAVFAGLAISIKWTGLSFWALLILIETGQCCIKLSYDSFLKCVKHVMFFILIPLMIYFSIFTLHFALLPKPGSGDAFMKPGFRERNFVENIWKLNIEMYKSNQRLGATHPYGSTWYTWPFMKRPIFYWVNENARVYFFGNPVIWWTSTAAVLLLLWQTSKRAVYSVFKKYVTLHDSHLTILLGGYFLNLLPFIGIKRVMFLYHYLATLIFAILILCYLINQNKNARKIFTGIVIAAIALFIFFAPLSYGLPLSDQAYELKIWFASWR